MTNLSFIYYLYFEFKPIIIMCKPIANPIEQKLLEDLTRFPKIFSQLTAEGDKNERLTAKITVAGYAGLNFLIMDILKAALLALESDSYQSSEIRDPNSNIASLIDLAIQLMPLEELELLDILHQHHLQKLSDKSNHNHNHNPEPSELQS